MNQKVRDHELRVAREHVLDRVLGNVLGRFLNAYCKLKARLSVWSKPGFFIAPPLCL